MKISCSAFVTAIYSLLAVLNLCKQELRGAGQLSALQLWLHVSLRLHFWEIFSPCPRMEEPWM